jgi:hypothetical protein
MQSALMLYQSGSTWNDPLHLACSVIFSKILRGLDNDEMNMGKMHPFAVKRNASGLGRRGTGLPLTTSPYRGEVWIGEISIGTPPKTLTGEFSCIILIYF